jgi:hypothetical protein
VVFGLRDARELASGTSLVRKARSFSTEGGFFIFVDPHPILGLWIVRSLPAQCLSLSCVRHEENLPNEGIRPAPDKNHAESSRPMPPPPPLGIGPISSLPASLPRIRTKPTQCVPKEGGGWLVPLARYEPTQKGVILCRIYNRRTRVFVAVSREARTHSFHFHFFFFGHNHPPPFSFEGTDPSKPP